MVEGARLESVYTSKGYRGFESLSLRSLSLLAMKHAVLKIHPKDNVIVALRDLKKGEIISCD